MAFSLKQAMAERSANQENQFFTSLLQYAMDSAPNFDLSGNTPQLLNAGKSMPPKSVLWNQYMQLKKGRITPEDLMKFEEMYKHVKNTRSNQQLSKINELSLRNYSDKKIRTMVSNNPIMYQNLIDMISDLKSEGTEGATARSEELRSYLPQKGLGQRYKEAWVDEPFWTGLKTAGGVGVAGAGALGLKRFGPSVAKNLYQRFRGGVTGAKPILDAAGKPIPGAGGVAAAGARGLMGLASNITGGLFMPQLAGMGVGFGASALGASPGTSQRFGKAVEGAGQAAWAARGLKGVSMIPHPAAKLIGYGGLGAYGLYNLYRAAVGE
jgi:hypothetical protein